MTDFDMQSVRSTARRVPGAETGQGTTAVPLRITARVAQPEPAEVRQARERAGLTQAQAAQLISPSTTKPYRTWQNYETPPGRTDHRPIPLAAWELFLLLTQQHPRLKLDSTPV